MNKVVTTPRGLSAVDMTQSVEGKITVLNPVGYPPKVTRKSAARRLESLDGKTIYFVCQIDSKWCIMHYARELKRQVPTCNIVFAYDVLTMWYLIMAATKPFEDPAWTWASIKDMEKEHHKADAAIVSIGF